MALKHPRAHPPLTPGVLVISSWGRHPTGSTPPTLWPQHTTHATQKGPATSQFVTWQKVHSWTLNASCGLDTPTLRVTLQHPALCTPSYAAVHTRHAAATAPPQPVSASHLPGTFLVPQMQTSTPLRHMQAPLVCSLSWETGHPKNSVLLPSLQQPSPYCCCCLRLP
jgi:hypothetical protein